MVNEPLEALQSGLTNLLALGDAPQDLAAWRLRLRAAREQSAVVQAHSAELVAMRTFPWSEVADLVQGLTQLISGASDEFERLFPWATSLAHPPAASGTSANCRTALQRLIERLKASDSLAALVGQSQVIKAEVAALRTAFAECHGEQSATAQALEWLNELEAHVASSSAAAQELDTRLIRLAEQMETWTREMDFAFLYNPQRRLFSIGFNIEDGQLDRAHYDMLASEARLATYLAIAKGDVDHRSWFQMGRPMTEMAGRIGSAVMGRHDVRIPDAAGLSAAVRRVDVGRELPGGRGTADRIWPPAAGSLGRIGVGL